MASELDSLKATVDAAVGVEQSAMTLIQGLAAQLKANANDPAKITSMAAELEAKTKELAAAVAANSPNTSTTPAPAGTSTT